MVEYGNAADLKGQLFYRLLEGPMFFLQLFVLKPILTYHFGGMTAVTWQMAVPLVWGWHITFLVNSAAHVWGRQPYDTGENSNMVCIE